jgi:hypothetical protein
MKVLMNKISYTAMAASAASDLIEAKKHDDKAGALRENVNKVIVVMNKDKVVIGRYSKDGTGCAMATSFVDTLTTGGWAKKTAQNYLSLFREAVKTGKPVKDWGGTKAGGRKAVASANSTKGKKEFADLFRPAFNHDKGGSFMALCKAIEKDYKDDKIKTMYEGFVEYFKSEGDEIAE